MIKASQIKDSFEAVAKSLLSSGSISTCCGVKRLHHLTLAVKSCSSSKYCLMLRAYYSLSDYVCVARSFPMSYKSVYRLVCSL